MDEKELQEQMEQIVGIDPAATLSGDASDWSTFKVTWDKVNDGSIPAIDELTKELEKLSFKTSKNPPEDMLKDVLLAHIATHYIIDRISRAEVVERIYKIWPDANGLDFSAFMDKLDIDKDAYWRKIRGEEKVGK